MVKILGFPVVLSLSSVLSKSKYICSIAKVVSYSSMNMYFFHRHVFLAFVILLNLHQINNIRAATIPIWVAYAVCIPILIAFSFFLQKWYDKIIH